MAYVMPKQAQSVAVKNSKNPKIQLGKRENEMQNTQINESLVRQMLQNRKYRFGYHSMVRIRDSKIFNVAQIIDQLAEKGGYSPKVNGQGFCAVLADFINGIEHRLVVGLDKEYDDRLFIITFFKATLNIKQGQNYRKFQDRDLVYEVDSFPGAA